MRPDRSNYEIWFTDWLDGNLGKKQVEELRIFLSENPDLQEELNGLVMINLEPSGAIYKGKEGLVKSPQKLSDIQFEHMCIADLENDLTPLQKTELTEIIDNDEKRKAEFEFIRKLKLKPPAERFRKKSSVKKLTPGQRIIRLSIIGLSTAAAVALVFTAYLSRPGNPYNELQQTYHYLTNDTLYIQSGAPHIIKKRIAESDFAGLRTESREKLAESYATTQVMTNADPLIPQTPDSLQIKRETERPVMLYVTLSPDILNTYKPPADNLMSYNPPYIPPLFGDNRSNVDRFIARFFHEKIMRDTISVNKPVKSFDIALAGITGLNKLFGWEMALHKNTSENGETRSYYFSSKLIKINAPVRKSENPL